jgi:hypothetical protein
VNFRVNPRRKLPSVIILKTHDVVFAEIIASLHFDENEICVRGVLNSMCSADRNVDRFTRMNEDLFAVASHFRRSLNYEPVFRAL